MTDMLREAMSRARVVTFLLLLTLSTRSQAADDGAASQAARSYELGTAAFEAERFTEAALEFEAAFRAVPHAVALFMAADAWERAGRLEQAADAWCLVPSAPRVSPEQRAQAEQRTRTLERLLGTVVITSSRPAHVKLDDGVERATPARLHGAAGLRTVVASIGDLEERQAIRLQSGQLLEIHLGPGRSNAVVRASEAAPGEPVAGSQVSWWTTPRVVGAGLLGAGVAALAVGAGFGVAATNTKETFDRTPTPALREQGLTEVRYTNLGLIGGSVLLLGGAGCLIWAPSPHASSAQASLGATASAETFSLAIAGRF